MLSHRLIYSILLDNVVRSAAFFSVSSIFLRFSSHDVADRSVWMSYFNSKSFMWHRQHVATLYKSNPSTLHVYLFSYCKVDSVMYCVVTSRVLFSSSNLCAFSPKNLTFLSPSYVSRSISYCVLCSSASGSSSITSSSSDSNSQ